MYLGTERRTARRVALRASVAFEIEGSQRGGRALNVSQAGLFLHTVAPVAVGDRLNLSIALRGDQTVRAIGRVVRRDDVREGFGLRFVEMPPDTWRAIRDFVASSAPG